MIKESSLPLGRETRFQGIKVRTRNWDSIEPGTLIQSIVGYVYEVGDSERNTIRNKIEAMLLQRHDDTTRMTSIFEKLSIVKVSRTKGDKRVRSDEKSSEKQSVTKLAEPEPSQPRQKLKFKTMRKK